MARLVGIILIALIVIGAIVLAFAFFRNNSKVRVITVTQEGKLDPNELKIANDEVVKIKNEDDVKHTIKSSANNSNVVTDLQPDRTSGELVFDDNSRNELYLAESTGEKTAVLVGNAPAAPETTQTPTPSPAATPSTAVQPSPNQPLPSTGPSDLWVYPISLLVGLITLTTTRKIRLIEIPKYKIELSPKNFKEVPNKGLSAVVVKQPETVLITFPSQSNVN